MKLYKTYLIKNLFKPLFVSLVTLTAIVWSSRIIRFMDLIVQDGADFLSFLKVTMLVLPPLVYIILPLTIFLTAVLTYNKLIENREIIILKNCGITKYKLLQPLIILSIIMALISYSISLYFSIKSNYLMRQIRQDIRDNFSFSMIKEGAFNKFKNLVIYCDSRDEENIYNVVIYNKSSNKQFLLQAEKATLLPNYVVLHNGNIHKFENGFFVPDLLFFEKQYINLEELTEEKTEIVSRIDTISTWSLIKMLSNKRVEGNGYTIEKVVNEICYRVVFPLVCIIMALLSGSLMLQGGFSRSNGTKTMLITSIISIIAYLAILSVIQKISSSIIFLYILILMIVIIISISLYLIKEHNLKEVKQNVYAQ